MRHDSLRGSRGSCPGARGLGTRAASDEPERPTRIYRGARLSAHDTSRRPSRWPLPPTSARPLAQALGEEGRGHSGEVALHLQDTDLKPKPRQLLSLRGGQGALRTWSSVEVGLLHLASQGRHRRVQVAGDVREVPDLADHADGFGFLSRVNIRRFPAAYRTIWRVPRHLGVRFAQERPGFDHCTA
jgi:hypothetical protein